MIISNHQSNIDAGLLGASINRDLKFPAKIELFKNPFMSFFLKSNGAFPIKRGIVDINSYRNIKKVLENKNGALSIFPEGTRDDAKIAKSHDPIIVPVGISGTLHLKGLFRVFNPSGNITVTIGNPFKLKKLGHNDDKEYFGEIKFVTWSSLINWAPTLPAGGDRKNQVSLFVEDFVEYGD